jgi:hypothetical protein
MIPQKTFVNNFSISVNWIHSDTDHREQTKKGKAEVMIGNYRNHQNISKKSQAVNEDNPKVQKKTQVN